MKNHEKCRAKKEEKIFQNNEVLHELNLHRLLCFIHFSSVVLITIYQKRYPHNKYNSIIATFINYITQLILTIKSINKNR